MELTDRLVLRGNPGGIVKFQSWRIEDGERVYTDRLVLRVSGDIETKGEIQEQQEYLT